MTTSLAHPALPLIQILTAAAVGRWRNKVPLVFASEQTTRFNLSILKHGSSELNTTRIDAKLKDGVLIVTIPKAETAKPHRIEVRCG